MSMEFRFAIESFYWMVIFVILFYEFTMIFTKKQKLQELTAEVAGIKAQLNGLGWRASDLGLSATASDLAEAQDKVHEAHRGLVALLEIAEKK